MLEVFVYREVFLLPFSVEIYLSKVEGVGEVNAATTTATALTNSHVLEDFHNLSEGRNGSGEDMIFVQRTCWKCIHETFSLYDYVSMEMEKNSSYRTVKPPSGCDCTCTCRI